MTIDSATLMNKGMEVIEAHWLFDAPYESIEVIVHRESIIHSMVQFTDGSIKAQLSLPDMRLPIQYAMTYPQRWGNPFAAELDWSRVKALTFEEVDQDKFPCLRLAIKAGQRGSTFPAVLSAADDVAVGLFLSGYIGFLDIARIIEATLERHLAVDSPSIEDILSADNWARDQVKELAL